jgi:Flp pilus assembly protein TadB
VNTNCKTPEDYESAKASWKKFGFKLRLFVIVFALLMILIGQTKAGSIIAIPLVFVAITLLIIWLFKSVKYLRMELKERKTGTHK